MLDSEVLSAINGKGSLGAKFKLPPADEIKLRPNAIYDLVYNKSVLHLGCTDHLELLEEKLSSGLYLHKQLTRISGECLGIDINTEAIAYLEKKGISNIIAADITRPGISQITEKQWDYLLMAEVLEHIDNPCLFLQSIAGHYKENINHVIITVPNVFGINHLAIVLNTGMESINSDHRYWFTPFTLCKVAYQAGLVIDDLIMCVYEGSDAYYAGKRSEIRDKPILMDDIILVAHWN